MFLDFIRPCTVSYFFKKDITCTAMARRNLQLILLHPSAKSRRVNSDVQKLDADACLYLVHLLTSIMLCECICPFVHPVHTDVIFFLMLFRDWIDGHIVE